MANVETPVEVGFAEFVARLMSEVFDSVITSQVDQEQRYAEMYAAAALSEDEYGRRNITDEDVAAELAGLFPPRREDEGRESAVYAGAFYQPAGPDESESPPLGAVLGITLNKKDLNEEDGRLVLNEAAVDFVVGAVRKLMAARLLGVVKQIMARGLPRVVVDSGRVNGKLTFHLTTGDESQADVDTDEPGFAAAAPVADVPRTAMVRPLPFGNIKNVFTIPRARILPNVKVMVKQADDRSPQSSQVKANVYGEVEITFKTIT